VVASAPAPLLSTDSKTAIPGSYIVVFKSGIAKATRDAHVRRVRGLAGGVTISERARFQLNDFGGYSAKLSNITLMAVRNQPEVAFVEADQTVEVGCVSQSGATWGINRISQRTLNLNGVYNYNDDAGAGVTAYIVDTGVYIEHAEFNGRAVWGENFVDTQDIDCNGHGTHVAGTTGGTAYGVAKAVSIVGVKVLNCGGSGTTAGVVNGVAWVGTDHQAKKNKGVANMSLGGGYSLAMNQAVAAAVATGVTFVVAAGNSDADACLFSPASEPTAISVVATDTAQEGTAEVDIRSSFSNFGTCTDIAAPGSDITSAWIGTTTAIRTISGTSMAAPHVCGAAALVLAQNPDFTPAQVQAQLQSSATQDDIDLQCGGVAACDATPNRLLYSSCP